MRLPMETAGLDMFDRVGPRQLALLLLGAVVLFVDGFDAQLVSYVAPAIARDWHLTRGAFAGVFAANVLGLMLGGVLITPIADMISRRRVTLACVGLIGCFSLLPLLAHTLGQLTLARLATGLVLGGAMPCIFATIADYLPARGGVRLSVLLSCAYSLGILICGVVTGTVIAVHGWRFMFWAGAILPLALVPLMLAFLPEAPAFLLAHGRASELRATVRRMGGRLPEGAVASVRPARAPLRLLFAAEYRVITPLLWAGYFCSGATLYFFLNWLPIFLTTAALSPSQAAWIAAGYQAGGLIGALFLGILIDRRGAAGFAVSLIGAAVAVAAIGFATGHLVVLAITAFAAGCLVVGSQNTMHPFVSGRLYPSALRATGLGWALGFLRLSGFLVGSLGAGLLIDRALGVRTTLLIIAVPELLAAWAFASIGRKARALPWTR